MFRWDLPCLLINTWSGFSRPNVRDDAYLRHYPKKSPISYSNPIFSSSQRLRSRFSVRDTGGSFRQPAYSCPSYISHYTGRTDDGRGFSTQDSFGKHYHSSNRRISRDHDYQAVSSRPLFARTTSIRETYMDHRDSPHRLSSGHKNSKSEKSTGNKRNTLKVHWDETTIHSKHRAGGNREQYHFNPQTLHKLNQKHGRRGRPGPLDDAEYRAELIYSRNNDYYQNEIDRRSRKSRDNHKWRTSHSSKY